MKREIVIPFFVNVVSALTVTLIVAVGSRYFAEIETLTTPPSLIALPLNARSLLHQTNGEIDPLLLQDGLNPQINEKFPEGTRWFLIQPEGPTVTRYRLKLRWPFVSDDKDD